MHLDSPCQTVGQQELEPKTTRKGGRWFPMGPTKVIVLVSLTILVSFVLHTHQHLRSSRNEMKARVAAVLHTGLADHLGQRAIASTRMAALTGDPRWEQRYRDAVSELTTVLSSAESDKYFSGAAIGRSSHAAGHFVEMCEQAFVLVHQGRLEDAQAIMFSQDVDQHLAAYVVGMPAISSPQEDVIRLVELHNLIASLDETLTMSARMFSVTGDPRWEHAYQEAVPALEEAVEEAQALVIDPTVAQGIVETRTANDHLVAMETLVLDLADQGRLAEAQRILDSEEYTIQKRAYAAGMTRLSSGLREGADKLTSGFLSYVHTSWFIGLLPPCLCAIILVLQSKRASDKLKVQYHALTAQAVELQDLNLRLDEQMRIDREMSQADQEHLARFPDENPDPVFRISGDGEILYGNPAAFSLMASQGLEIADLVSVEWREVVEATLGNGRCESIESACGDKTFAFTFTPLVTNDYVNIYGHDITERKKAEETLESQAMTDQLTGLRNRRYFLDIASHELDQIDRYGGEISLVTLDIDHFKTINDTYGHSLGDQVLRDIGKTLLSEARQADFVARLGGDEFLILMPHTSLESAVIAANRILSRIAECRSSDGKITVSPTASAGVGTIRGGGGQSTATLLKLSDDATYLAKRCGRNCTRTSKDVEEESALASGAGEGKNSSRIEELQLKMAQLRHLARESSVRGIWSLIQALEARDPYTRDHSENVTRYAVGIAEAMELGREDIEVLRQAAIVHDIGKIGVPDNILLKKTPFTPEEREQMETHVLTGVRILEETHLLEQEIVLMRCHHERWDGRGYPEGVWGDAIPVGARILAVADTLDAITSNRVYRNGRDVSTALRIITEEAGAQFDPSVVDGLMRWVETIGQVETLTTHQILATQTGATGLSGTLAAA
jgi:diguanylate cyclase (GGDEF)-like protein/putative nucleotidyltransferase with HDIG domain